ncbi:MAG: type II secretion system protein M [Candidatus Contendobacter sp.]|nr:type II secretion system protein M [Candidatus Contendobacter sp.]
MKAWWNSLSLRERSLIGGGMALTLTLLLYAQVWRPFSTSHHRLQRSVAEQRADLAWMRQAAQEIQRLSGASDRTHATADGRSLLTRVDQTARAAGFGPALKRIAPQGNDQLSVQLDAIEFDQLIPWLKALERNQRTVIINLSADRAAAAGRSNVRLILGSRP